MLNWEKIIFFVIIFTFKFKLVRVEENKMPYQMRIHQCSSIPKCFFSASQFRRVSENCLKPKGTKFRFLTQPRKPHCRPNSVNPREALIGQKRRRNSEHSGERSGRRRRRPRRRRRLRQRRRRMR